MTYGRLIIFLTLFSIKVIGQSDENNRDSIKKELALQKKQWSDDYKNTIKDSIDFTGILLDKYEGMCGCFDAPGLLVFKVTKTNSKKHQDNVLRLLAVFC